MLSSCIVLCGCGAGGALCDCRQGLAFSAAKFALMEHEVGWRKGRKRGLFSSRGGCFTAISTFNAHAASDLASSWQQPAMRARHFHEKTGPPSAKKHAML